MILLCQLLNTIIPFTLPGCFVKQGEILFQHSLRHKESRRECVCFNFLRIASLRRDIVTKFDWKLFVNMDLV